jgi:hypothetical protein
MTFHFNEFDSPAALEDEGLNDLTGCPISRRIQSACTEEGCPNNPAGANPPRLQVDNCLRRNEALGRTVPIWPNRQQREIYQTEPKNSCVM